MYSHIFKFFSDKPNLFNLLFFTIFITSFFLLCISFCLLFIVICDIRQSNVSQRNSNNSLKIVCYYNFPVNGTYLQPEGIPANLCTHINLAFFGINQTDFSLHVARNNLQIIPKLSKLQEKNKDLKIIVSVGGSGNNDFSQMIKNHSNRKMFINSTMRFLKKYNLDGVDIDWEWPGGNGDTKEKIKFIQLLQEMRTEFDRHQKHYILSIAVAATRLQIDVSYYVQYIPKYVDYINLMTYDYHFFTSYYPVTDHNAPMFASAKENNSMLSELNVNFSVNYWKSQSMPLDKIIMGLPSYGHTYKLVSSLNHDIHAPASGFGSVGTSGFIIYHEICAFLTLLNTFKVRDPDSKVPYAYNQYDWISYDDEHSFKIKADYIIREKLGGAMIYSLNSEDYTGTCRKDKTKFPLIQRVKSAFHGHL